MNTYVNKRLRQSNHTVGTTADLLSKRFPG